jgi:hypothetical protein
LVKSSGRFGKIVRTIWENCQDDLEKLSRRFGEIVRTIWRNCQDDLEKKARMFKTGSYLPELLYYTSAILKYLVFPVK